MMRKALGRGLEALIPAAPPAPEKKIASSPTATHSERPQNLSENKPLARIRFPYKPER